MECWQGGTFLTKKKKKKKTTVLQATFLTRSQEYFKYCLEKNSYKADVELANIVNKSHTFYFLSLQLLDKMIQEL